MNFMFLQQPIPLPYWIELSVYACLNDFQHDAHQCISCFSHLLFPKCSFWDFCGGTHQYLVPVPWEWGGGVGGWGGGGLPSLEAELEEP